MIPNDDWKQDGLCRQMDPDMFFPERRDEAIVKYAKAACALCDVREKCLEVALSNPDGEFGIWGGTDEVEREQLLQRGGVFVVESLSDLFALLQRGIEAVVVAA